MDPFRSSTSSSSRQFLSFASSSTFFLPPSLLPLLPSDLLFHLSLSPFLSHVVQWEAVDTLEDAFDAIKSMKIRGAPAIGSLAGLVLAHVLATSIASSPRPTIFATTESFLSYLQEKTVYLNGARPTAVNLGEAMGRMYKAGEEAVKAGSSVDDAVKKVVEVGREVHVEDLGRNILMSQRGADWIAKVTGKTKDIRILTVRPQPSLFLPFFIFPPGQRLISTPSSDQVCNTGSLATSGMGTALGVITNLSQTGRLGRAYYTQTAREFPSSLLASRYVFKKRLAH